MNILVTNDDGINAKGLRSLVNELSKIADVYIIAPEGERSANSHHITISGRIRYELVEVENAKKAYAVWGTPADCVHGGIRHFIKDKIDLIVSGINRGPNLSSDIIYSGTIAAAREGYLQGIPSMAVSLCDFEAKDYELAAVYARQIALKYLEIKDNTHYFISVNIPNNDDIKGILICDKVVNINYRDEFVEEIEDGKNYINIKGIDRIIDYDKNDLRIDLSAIEANYISISPLANMHISRNHIDSIKILEK